MLTLQYNVDAVVTFQVQPAQESGKTAVDHTSVVESLKSFWPCHTQANSVYVNDKHIPCEDALIQIKTSLPGDNMQHLLWLLTSTPFRVDRDRCEMR